MPLELSATKSSASDIITPRSDDGLNPEFGHNACCILRESIDVSGILQRLEFKVGKADSKVQNLAFDILVQNSAVVPEPTVPSALRGVVLLCLYLLLELDHRNIATYALNFSTKTRAIPMLVGCGRNNTQDGIAS